MTRVTLYTAAPEPFAGYLAGCGWEVGPDGDLVVVLGDRPLSAADERALLAHADAGCPLVLAGAATPALLDRAGVVAVGATVPHELRVRLGADAGDVGARFGDELLVTGSLRLVDKVTDDTA